MLLIMYQIFSSLQGHLPFSVHFLLHFYGVTFFGTPNIATERLDSVLSAYFGVKTCDKATQLQERS